jgi:cytochrome c
MTGPSLAQLWNRKAESLESFPRLLLGPCPSGVVWNDNALDDWIKDPQHLVAGITMMFQGIRLD